MSHVDRQVLNRLLRSLEASLTRLRALRLPDPADPATVSEREWALERGLQVCIQTVLDLGAHILAAHPSGPIDDYTGLIDGLVALEVIPEDLGRRMRPMPGLRNLLVHDYAEVDPLRLAELTSHGLGDFDEFLAAVVSWLERRK
ncbi:MAG: DUF86 domain-containing protein [Candidatus Riflebacteria bacterium]|nr:DUF86 domain-containing protein [Candidatus Riflebacteria bacterium]